MPLASNLAGQTFGRWTVIRAIVGSRNKKRKWFCVCKCGTRKEVAAWLLASNQSKSCGCLKIEVATARIVALNYRHGHKAGRASREYVSWQAMIQRCTNPNLAAWKHYGGRGIGICREWRYSFDTFLRDMGPRPLGKELDRIDNNAGYSPTNCRWATKSQQIANTRPRCRNELGQFK